MATGEEKGIEKGLEQGRETGLLEGKREALLQLLAAKFGQLSELTTKHVQAIDSVTSWTTIWSRFSRRRR